MSDFSHAVPAPREAEPFFHHGDPRACPSGPLTPVTRYLCGAAYLDENYPDRVIDELITDPQRAVVPAHGFDIEAVVRHCFRARRIWTLQSVWICVILAIAALVAWWPTVLVVTLAIALMLKTSSPQALRGRGRWPAWKLAAGLAVGLIVLTCVVGPLISLIGVIGALDSSGLTGLEPDSGEGLSTGVGSTIARFMLAVVVISALVLTGLTWARLAVLRTLASDLAPNVDHQPPVLPPSPAMSRLADVAAAQHGNIVMHSHFEPFLGAGQVVEDASVAMELSPDKDGPHPLRTSAHALPVEVDAVQLVRHIRRRVAALRSADLPESQRILGLTIRDQIMVRGTHWRDFELIDRYQRPYAHASREAVEAIIQHPQASARHVLRVMVSVDGADVSSAGRAVLGAESQGIVVSSFTHVAVEGRMLFIEHTATVLGQLRPVLYEIDRYQPHQGGLLWDAFVDALRRFGRATLLAPVQIVRTAVGHFRLYNRLTGPPSGEQNHMVRDFGARADIRQMVSEPVFHDFLQRLDAEKYVKLINRRIVGAVIEYLEEHGIDTSEYSTRVNINQDLSTRITNSHIGGGVVGGAGNTSTRVAAGAKGRAT